MKKQKRTLTLLEIMIVIFLITLITGTIGYNMKGTLDRGRAFRTEQGKTQLRDLLLFCIEEGEKPDDVAKDPAIFLKRYNLAKNSEKLVQDGWGENFIINYSKKDSDFSISSKAHDKYKKKLNQEVAAETED